MVPAANRALARVIWPFLLWMAIGWALFPYGIDTLLRAVGESMESPAIRPVAMAYSMAFAVLTIVAIWYGHSRPNRSPGDMRRRNTRMTCPRCRNTIRAGSTHCPTCGAWIPR